jgi:glycerol-3-phosphate dehydrogenase
VKQGHASVRAEVTDLAARQLDLLVIGGGITGAGILRDAAMRGLAAALVDRGDFGTGTSSRSSRLVHGGLRYLEQFQWGLVFEALRERAVLFRIAPHLVRRLAFVIPVHRGDRVPRWKLTAGLGLYGLLAAGGNVPRPRMLGKAGLLALEPNLRARGLRGGGLYWDAQCDDARLVLATLRAAQARGGLAANYVEVTALEQREGRITGALLHDRLTDTRATVRARVVVNATGPWSDLVRKLEDPGAAPILRPTKGAHVMVRRSRIGHTHGITFTSPVDGRVMFILPWGDLSYIGTTDTDLATVPEDVAADAGDLRYLLRSANALFPHARLAEEDVIATWAGLRALLAGDPRLPASALSREHRILRGPLGMLTIAGGKLTTYRRMAAELVDAAVRALGGAEGLRARPRPPTDLEPLPGGESTTGDSFLHAGRDLGLPGALMEHLMRLYGTEAAAILNLVREDRSLATPIHPRHVAIGAQVVHAARREMAQRVEDVLDRRLHLTTETGDHGHAAAPQVARLLGRELGWSADRVQAEAARFQPPSRHAATASPGG